MFAESGSTASCRVTVDKRTGGQRGSTGLSFSHVAGRGHRITTVAEGLAAGAATSTLLWTASHAVLSSTTALQMSCGVVCLVSRLYRVLIGACDPMLCPNWGCFRADRPDPPGHVHCRCGVAVDAGHGCALAWATLTTGSCVVLHRSAAAVFFFTLFSFFNHLLKLVLRFG